MAEIPVTQAISGPDSSEWMDAMAAEVRFLIKNDTWELVRRPENHRVIGSRFVLRNKYNSDGILIERRKARLVARGFSQRPGINFNETFAPVARMSSIRAAVAVAVRRDMKIEQIDITTAYLNGNIEEVFMEVPEYLEEILENIARTRHKDTSIKEAAKKMLEGLKESDVVCLVKRALYGLRQAGRAWHLKLDKELRELGAVPSKFDSCLYLYGSTERRSYYCLRRRYIDHVVRRSRYQENKGLPRCEVRH